MQIVITENGTEKVVFESDNVASCFRVQAEWVKKAKKNKNITYVGYKGV